MNKPISISILGCGWYGLALAKSLVTAGYRVKGSTTSADKTAALQEQHIIPYIVNFTADNELFDPQFFDCDVLWVAIPPKSKSGEGDEYMLKMQRIIRAAQRHEVKQLVHISSTGVYGDHDQHVDESTSPEPISASGKVLLAVEDMLRGQEELTTTIIRFGGLLGPGREPGRFFAGKTGIPNGRAPVNLIHLDDCVGISHAILNRQAFGYTYNACSPHHPAKADFYTKAAVKAGLAQPQFVDELLEWKIVNSIYVNETLHYNYAVTDWDKWQLI